MEMTENEEERENRTENAVVEAGEEDRDGAEDVAPGVMQVVQEFFRRVAGARKTGLFGQY